MKSSKSSLLARIETTFDLIKVDARFCIDAASGNDSHSSMQHFHTKLIGSQL